MLLVAHCKKRHHANVKMMATTKTQVSSPAFRVKHCALSCIHQNDMNIILKTSASVKAPVQTRDPI
ncbi:hypothetical protein B4099_2293 [Heyndrickxia coagulans]|uniref:Uncharacterized protein n=1 Tax=Heyndrickxia coagulans TaxID=1398 RepID=A0A150KB26_HEYCO|nr:hypothetical protein B4099_2293 [Heyndrickxia coagulans]